MKCVITNEETKSMSSNIPLSREGRRLLPEIHEKHNEKIKDFYIKNNLEKDTTGKLTEEFLAKLAPKINKSYALRLLHKQEKDIIETRDEVLG